jgi:hypothetical protein
MMRRLLDWRLRYLDLDEKGKEWSGLRLRGDDGDDMVVMLVAKEQEEGRVCRDREALARRDDEREGSEVGGA